MKKSAEDDRIEEIQKRIRRHFDRGAPGMKWLEAQPELHVIACYATITRISGAQLHFREAYSRRDHYGPVLCPMFLWGLLRRLETHLAVFGREQDRWELLYLGPPIEKLP